MTIFSFYLKFPVSLVSLIIETLLNNNHHKQHICTFCYRYSQIFSLSLLILVYRNNNNKNQKFQLSLFRPYKQLLVVKINVETKDSTILTHTRKPLTHPVNLTSLVLSPTLSIFLSVLYSIPPYVRFLFCHYFGVPPNHKNFESLVYVSFMSVNVRVLVHVKYSGLSGNL